MKDHELDPEILEPDTAANTLQETSDKDQPKEDYADDKKDPTQNEATNADPALPDFDPKPETDLQKSEPAAVLDTENPDQTAGEPAPSASMLEREKNERAEGTSLKPVESTDEAPRKEEASAADEDRPEEERTGKEENTEANAERSVETALPVQEVSDRAGTLTAETAGSCKEAASDGHQEDSRAEGAKGSGMNPAAAKENDDEPLFDLEQDTKTDNQNASLPAEKQTGKDDETGMQETAKDSQPEIPEDAREESGKKQGIFDPWLLVLLISLCIIIGAGGFLGYSLCKKLFSNAPAYLPAASEPAADDYPACDDYPIEMSELPDFADEKDSGQTKVDLSGKIAGQIVTIEDSENPDNPGTNGIVLSKDGYIAVNTDKLPQTGKLIAALEDGSTFQASLIAQDDFTGIGVVKADLKERELLCANLDCQASLKKGQQIVICGSTAGMLPDSMITGTLSSVSRRFASAAGSLELIQYTAPDGGTIFGGGLYDESGCLIGMSVSCAENAGTENTGFAISAAGLKELTDSLIDDEDSSKPLLGVVVVWHTGIGEGEEDPYGLMGETGLYILSVTENSAADKAGLKAGDRIVSVDKLEMRSASQLSDLIAQSKPGDKMKIKILRGGKEMQISVVLGSAKETS